MNTYWHGSKVMIEDFGPAAGTLGVHFGTRDQAEMRNAAFLHEVILEPSSTCRSRDRQSWGEIAKRARRNGHDAVVYLNRFEGMRIDRLTALLDAGHGDRLDTMSDRDFRKLVPEARDSFLVVNPDILEIVRILDRDGNVLLDNHASESPEP